MCQIMGMNCAAPTDFNFSFKGFKCRGGATDVHSHGWGLAIYEGRGVRSFHDTAPCAESPLADMVSNYPIKTLNMMAHVRYATQGAVELENVHPFQREMWGIQWTFAHNGEVPKFGGNASPILGAGRQESGAALPQHSWAYHPVGDTDSEATFCAMLNALRAEFSTLPTLPVLYEAIQRLSAEIIREGGGDTIFNFLLGCGQFTMFAFSWPGSRPGSKVWNGLHYLVRWPPFSAATLTDVDYSVDFSTTNDASDRVAIIATKPLTANENWHEFKRGELLMFDRGLPHSRPYECAEAELLGRGLSSRAMPSGVLCPKNYQYNIPVLLRRAVAEALGRKDCCDVVAMEPDFEDGGDEQLHVLSSSPTSVTMRKRIVTDQCWAERGIDLGCGSGLSGAAFRTCVRHLTGVDLSPEMVYEARDRNIYDRLMVGDIEQVVAPDHRGGEAAGGVAQDSAIASTIASPLHRVNSHAGVHRLSVALEEAAMPTRTSEPNWYDFAFACDLFAYIGDLRPIFGSARRILELKGGTFAFSAEILDDDEEGIVGDDGAHFVMQRCARFAHKWGYISSLADEFGFETLVASKSTVLRKHDNREVHGAIVVLNMPSS